MVCCIYNTQCTVINRCTVCIRCVLCDSQILNRKCRVKVKFSQRLSLEGGMFVLVTVKPITMNSNVNAQTSTYLESNLPWLLVPYMASDHTTL